MKKSSLTEGNIGKALLFFVLPIIAGSLIQQLYTTVDAVIVGQFTGKTGLAERRGRQGGHLKRRSRN